MKELEITLEQLPSTSVLHVGGAVDSNTAPELQKALLRATEAPTGGVELDLAKVSYMSSAGLRALLLAAKALQNRGEPLSSRHPVRRNLPDHTQGQLRFLELLHFFRARRARRRRSWRQRRADAADKPNSNRRRDGVAAPHPRVSHSLSSRPLTGGGS